MTTAHLIDARDLATLIEQHNVRVVDCRFSLADVAAGRKAYLEGHIPGAIYAHLDDDLSGPITPTSGRHPLPAPATFANRMRQWHIAPDTRVIAYDDLGGAIAARLWWLMKWAAHDNVAVLNGGFQSWAREGLSVETDDTSTNPRTDSTTATERSEMVVTAEQVARATANSDCLLLDARAPDRYAGSVEPIDTVAGHVPYAVNAPFKTNLDDDGCFLESSKLREKFERVIGERSPASVVHMCGSGVTACHNILAMEIAGLSGSKLYAGSWSEWIRDPNRPVATS